MKPDAVFFDLFETLITEFIDGKRISRRNYDYPGLLGLSAADFKTEWGSRSTRRMNGELPDFPSVIRDILAGRGLAPDEEAIAYLYRERLAEKELPLRAIRPDILGMLTALRSSGIRIGLISNCTEEEVRHWPLSQLAASFDDVVFSYEAGCAKPDERIYRIACERLGVRPDRSVFVGDGGSRELEGAHAAGMAVYHAFWFNTYIESPFPKLTAPEELLQTLGIAAPPPQGEAAAGQDNGTAGSSPAPLSSEESGSGPAGGF
ncbi:hypothetical protein J31TS4_21920 [Paenibacillus sp. J31TS4]|uniref:HAD family hydrolase n=1 Tax=Paenibacillus sp. J31TS4 TaxID=2807195 RepID=UPI001B166533|nr:HAD family hydrolase [Paenibacillus sp. J31TS4]GIP38912.1 hypothetical protein J31TS4_21920 [Paenibacillus sp. J31TS4]